MSDETTHRDDLRLRPTTYATRNRNLVIVFALVVVMAMAVVTLALVFWKRNQTRKQSPPPAADTKETGEPNEVVLSAAAMKTAGIEIVGVTQRPAVALMTVTGSVETNQQQTQQVTPLVGGRIERVNVALGDRVRAGMVLASIASPEIAEMRGKLREARTHNDLARRNLQRVQRTENRVALLSAKAKLDEAEATLKRTKRLIELGVGAGKDLIAAESAYKTARAEYDFQNNISLSREVQEAQAEVDTTNAEVTHLEQSLQALGASTTLNETNTAMLSLRAPVSGAITERLVNPGAGIEAGKPLFTIANISTVWVIASVPEAQLSQIHVGSSAEIRSSSLGDAVISGHVSYIDPQVNQDTHTARVRVEVSNAGERLKPGMFVEVGFQTGSAAPGQDLVIPAEAVQRIGDRHVVFVPDDNEPGHFKVHDVELGSQTGGYYRVLTGLTLDNKVVTKGSFTLKAQMMKSQFGEDVD